MVSSTNRSDDFVVLIRSILKSPIKSMSANGSSCVRLIMSWIGFSKNVSMFQNGRYTLTIISTYFRLNGALVFVASS